MYGPKYVHVLGKQSNLETKSWDEGKLLMKVFSKASSIWEQKQEEVQKEKEIAHKDVEQTNGKGDEGQEA